MIGKWSNCDTPLDIVKYLDMKHIPNVAMFKVIICHPNVNMQPFFHWKLKFLPLVVAWFDKVRSIRSISENTPRELSAVYQFVRGMPMLVAGCFAGQNDIVHIDSRKRKHDEIET